MKRLYLLLLIIIVVAAKGLASTKSTIQYAQKDSAKLFMDVYMPSTQSINNTCIIYMFGGGFSTGLRDYKPYIPFFEAMADSGFVVISIDYRLGLKDVKKFSRYSIKTFERALDMAVEDLYSAVNFAIEHSAQLKIDPNQIVLCGSSAGAITSLQADYELANHMENAEVLPDNFRFAGVIALSGAVYSTKGNVKYKYMPPAPTLMFHGTEDRLVNYNKIKVFNYGLFGTNYLSELFSKNDYSYYAFRYKNLGHEVNQIALTKNQREIYTFIKDMTQKQKKYQLDVLCYDPFIEPEPYSYYTPAQLYKNKDKLHELRLKEYAIVE